MRKIQIVEQRQQRMRSGFIFKLNRDQMCTWLVVITLKVSERSLCTAARVQCVC